jgi:hypothetical protein
MKTITKYTGELLEGNMYECKSDGNKVRVSKIYQEAKNKVWTCELIYADSQTKQGSTLNMPCYDFEGLLRRGQFRKIN